MQNAEITFVIVAYNDVAGVARHFDYFAASGETVELIVVDDCSTDGLDALVASAQLPASVHLRYRRNPENRGPGASRNSGLVLVDTKYVMFLDADDLLSDSFFHYLRLSPLANGADFVLFKYHLSTFMEQRQSYTMHPEDNQFFSNIGLCSFPNRTFALEEIPSVLRTINFPWNKVYRTAFLRRAGILFPSYRMHEDILPHWTSFLAAGRFGILHWAPPLIHHFEAPNAKRATNYFGEHRLRAFDALLAVHTHNQEHRLAEMLHPELIAFSEGLGDWMIRNAPAAWGQRYATASTVFFAQLGRAGVTRAATLMGQILE